MHERRFDATCNPPLQPSPQKKSPAVQAGLSIRWKTDQ
jgi:hypothetical protein